MAIRRWTVTLGMTTSLLLLACGQGDRSGFLVPVNQLAIEAAGSANLPDDLIWANLSAGNVEFSHGVHMVYADNCEVCHPEPWAIGKSPHGTIQMAPMYQGQSCGACHDGQKAFEATECERCHAFDSAINTQPTFTWGQNGFGPVEFSHTLHLMADSECNECHPLPWGWTVSPGGTHRMTQMYGSGSCGACHNGRDAFDATACDRCHDRDNGRRLEMVEGVPVHEGHEVPADYSLPGADVGEVTFSHTNHVIAGLDCDRCHWDVFDNKRSVDGTHLMKTMYAGGSCGACHDGRISFPATDCAACHEGALNPVEAAHASAAPPPNSAEG